MNTTTRTDNSRSSKPSTNPEDVYQRFLRAQERFREGHYKVRTYVRRDALRVSCLDAGHPLVLLSEESLCFKAPGKTGVE